MKYRKRTKKGSVNTSHVIACILTIILLTGTACGKEPKADSQSMPESGQTLGQKDSAPESPAPGQEPSSPENGPAPGQEPSSPENGPAAQPNTPSQASGGSQISLEEAKNAALSDAGVSSSDAFFTMEKLDYEDGIAVYEIEFYTTDSEYDYEIEAATGAVYSRKTELLHSENDPNGHSHNSHHSGGGSSSDIGLEGAKSSALSHAGFSASEVTFSKTELDTEDGQWVYEIEFFKDGREYEYVVLASDGSILEYEVD